MTDGIDLRHVPRWIRRSFDAILADFKVVDCGSLDVLLYCADDLDGQRARQLGARPGALTGDERLRRRAERITSGHVLEL